MPKVMLDVISIGAVEAELPEKCPNPECGADFTNDEEMNLVEHQYTSENRACFIEGEFEGTADIFYGELQDMDPVTHTTGYACSKCQTIIVTTEKGLL